MSRSLEEEGDFPPEKPLTTTPPSLYYLGSQAPSSLPSVPAVLQNLKKREALTVSASRLCIVLVGLPGRGKSFIGRKLANYLNWKGHRCKVFNVGKYRREVAGSATADFFKGSSASGSSVREQVAQAALKDMFEWLEEPVVNMEKEDDYKDVMDSVAIFDATNSTVKRREMILNQCASRRFGVGVVFVESICDQPDLLEENFRQKIKISPDFADMPFEEALVDLKARVKNYESVYETIDDDTCSYIKVYNLSAKIMANQIFGRMSKTIIPCLMAWNIGSRPIWLCRAGETDGGVGGKTGKGTFGSRRTQDANLSDRGKELRDKLATFVHDKARTFHENQSYTPGMGSEKLHDEGEFHGVRLGSGLPVDTRGEKGACKIMCSTMPRAYQTAALDEDWRVEQFSSLNPLDKGDFTGLEMEEIKEVDPEWYAQLRKDPFQTRFPGGESYYDLIQRLESCLIDMEQQVAPVLIVSHVSVLQCLVAYFRGSPVQECTSIAFPMDTLVEMVPVQGGSWKENRYSMLPRSRVNSKEPLPKSPKSPTGSISEEGGEVEEGNTTHPIWGDS
ncbi:hypothetical protein TrVE_jg11884 [Triparma verrucosa]|uniref:6-phosphofructo-2-kinase domain-containing protein n=1 Tax=Triparma verrucosa TaxID=1606542 RepID=A0A9W7BXI4_9STRA|nr:hypothetical protein TrVE_jg11884 [Triparma verrucosa]